MRQVGYWLIMGAGLVTVMLVIGAVAVWWCERPQRKLMESPWGDRRP